MPSILDRVAAQRYSQVSPQTTQEFFALQLAGKLGDRSAARHYVELVAQRSEESVLLAYRRATKVSGQSRFQAAKNFHAALQRANGDSPAVGQTRLLSINVERRTISVAVFLGQQLEDTGIRHLPPNPDKAESSAVSFIRWFINNYSVESAAMETLPMDRKVQPAPAAV